jgi:hypothetical protein
MLHFLFGLLIVAVLLSFTAGRWLVGLCVLGGGAFVVAILMHESSTKVSQVAASAAAPPPTSYEPYVIPSGRHGELTAAQEEAARIKPNNQRAHAQPTAAEERGRSAGRRMNENPPKYAHDVNTPEFVFDDAAEAARVRAIEAALPVVAPATAQKLLVDALPAAPLDFDKCVAGPRGHHCRAYIDPLRECHRAVAALARWLARSYSLHAVQPARCCEKRMPYQSELVAPRRFDSVMKPDILELPVWRPVRGDYARAQEGNRRRAASVTTQRPPERLWRQRASFRPGAEVSRRW